MKIAIDARKWRDYGIGTYVRNLVRHLAHIDHESTYYLFCRSADESILRDLAENFVPVVNNSRIGSIREHLFLPRRLHILGAELFHTPHHILPLLCRIPSIVTVHDCIPLLFPQYLPNRMAWRYSKMLMGRAIRRSAAVLTVSEASRHDILHFYPNTDPKRVRVVPNAIDDVILAQPSEEEMNHVRERYQVTGRFILYAGNIRPHKNLDRLIAAFGALKEQPGHEDVKLLIIGDEINRYGSLRRSVEAAQVRQDVRFFGFVPDQTLAALYRLAAIFAFPSLYEGFGLPPLEAMACGTPVLTSRLSSLPEVVGDAALLIDPYDTGQIASALARLLSDQVLRQTLIEKGYERIQHFSWERSARAIHRTYMNVLGIQGAAAPVATAAALGTPQADRPTVHKP